MRDRILSELDKRRADLARLDEQRVVLGAQISLLEELLGVADLQPTRSVPRTGTHEPKGESTRLSARWVPVLREAVRRYPDAIAFEDVPALQHEAGQEPADANNIRSHFWNYSKPGKFYERVEQGKYRATQVGADLIGIALGHTGGATNNNGADNAAPSSDLESKERDSASASSDTLDLLNTNHASQRGGGT